MAYPLAAHVPAAAPALRLNFLRAESRVAAAIVLIGLGFAVPPVVKAARSFDPVGNKDYSLWYEVGLTVRNGGPLYGPAPGSVEVQYMYPPTLAVLGFAPLSGLGYAGFVAGFALANAACWAACVRLAPLLVAPPGERISFANAAIPAVASGVYAWDMFHLGQVNLLLLLLVLAGWHALRAGRGVAAGAAVGLAIAIKVFPLPILVYLAFRRKWAAVAAAVVTVFLAVAVLPAPARGFARNWAELGEWATLMIGDQSGNTMAARSSIGFSRRNQSLVSVSHRLLRPVEAGQRYGEPFFVNVADVSPRAAQLVGLGACGLLGLVLLGVTRCRFAPTAAAEGQEWGMVLTLVVLCSPLAWTYFFCWLLPGFAAAVRFNLNPAIPAVARRWGNVALSVAGVMLAAAFTEQFDPTPQAWGVTAWGGVLVFLTLAGMRWYEGRRPPIPTA